LRSIANFSRSVTQSSVPIHLVMILLRSGLQKRIHLLGVTPFVLFWNFSGHNCQKSYDDEIWWEFYFLDYIRWDPKKV